MALAQVHFGCIEMTFSHFSLSFLLPFLTKCLFVVYKGSFLTSFSLFACLFWHNCLFACLAGPKSRYFCHEVILEIKNGAMCSYHHG